ncbi:MAG: TRAP transporter small permease [Proteobacteria bacterium]|nr:TRAP transporter small permease [Pseudomonadota bacterium]
MQRFSKVFSRLALGMLLLGAMGMIVSMFLGVADVVGTKFLGMPVHGTLEITESTMVLIVFGALAYTQERRGHIRVELLYNHVGPRGKSFMEAVTHFLALVYFALVCWQGIGELRYSWELREATMGAIRFPLYPARFLLVAGTLLLILQLVLDMMGDLGRMWRGEPPPPPLVPPQLTEDELPQGS